MAISSRAICEGPSSPEQKIDQLTTALRTGALLKSSCVLTNGDTDVRAAEVDVRLGDGSHANLVVCAAEEAGESAAESNSAVTSCAADRHSNHVLLRNETLHETVRIRFLHENIHEFP